MCKIAIKSHTIHEQNPLENDNIKKKIKYELFFFTILIMSSNNEF